MNMHRSMCAFALLAFGVLAPPAFATDASVGFQCCSYTPNNVRILPGETVTFTGAGGADFADMPGSDHHPLHFTNASIGDQTDASTSTYRPFAASGIYTWYCGNHGQHAGTTVSGMSGKVTVTTNQPPTADFTASATSVASGTEVTFDGSSSHDPDGDIASYAWDLDGDGQPDPGQTGETPSATFTNTGVTSRAVTVRLTVTDNNGDAVGPESSTRSTVITVAPVPGATPPPGGGPAPNTGPADDTTPPVVHLALARSLTVATKLRVTFTTDERASALARLKVGKRTARASRDFAAGKHTLTVKLSKAIRRLLRHRRTVTLTLAVTDDAGNGTTLKRALKLKAR